MSKTNNHRLDEGAKILIVRLGAIGDVIHTLPAVASLRRQYPGAHLAWVVERGGAAQVLRDNPLIDQLIELDLTARRGMLGRALAPLSGFDLALDFQGLIKSSLLARLSGIRRRIGFDFGSLREPIAGLFLTERVAADDDLHIIEKNLRLVSHLGVEPLRPYRFAIEPGAKDEDFARQVIGSASPRFAILNPGGGWKTKLWPPERFGALADRLWRECRITSLVTHGPGEEMLAHRVVEAAREGKAVALPSTLKQFLALAQRAMLFVGGDTGPMHLAAAAGAPIVALLGPTSARRNGPFSPDDVVIEREDLECRIDCYRRRCDHCSCMDLEVERVWAGAQERLQKAGV